MTRDEIRAIVEASSGRQLRITFSDGVTQSVDVAAVDDEGVLHSGPDGSEPKRILDSIRKYRGDRL
jgi:hypothetical protein